MTKPAAPAATGKDRSQRASGVTVNRRTFVLVFLALMLSNLLASLNNTIIAAATPTIVGELHGVEHITWVVTAFILSSTIMMPIFGNLSDLLGRKVLLIIGISVFMSGSVFGAVAWDIESLIAARLVQGLGGGGLIILSQAVIADIVPARQRGQYMGIMGSVFAFSSVAGPLLGGWLTDGPGWRWAFWINIPLGVLALLGTIFFLRLPKRRRDHVRVDYWGIMLLAIATSSLVLVSVWGGTDFAWNSPVIIGLIASTVLAAIGFVLVERKATSPIIPLHMFRHRNFVLTTIASFAIGIAMFGTLGYMPTYLQMTTGFGAAIAGLLMVPMMATMLVTGIVVGRIVTLTGRYKWAPVCGNLIVVLALVLLGTLASGAPVWLVCLFLATLGLGIGTSMQVLTLTVQNEFPNAMVGTATASNNFFRQIGASLGSAIVGALFASRLTDIIDASTQSASQLPADGASSLTPALVWGLPAPLRDVVIGAYNEALLPIYLWMAPIVIVGFVVTLLLREKPLATTIERDIPTESLATGQITVAMPERDLLDQNDERDDALDGPDDERDEHAAPIRGTAPRGAQAPRTGPRTAPRRTDAGSRARPGGRAPSDVD